MVIRRINTIPLMVLLLAPSGIAFNSICSYPQQRSQNLCVSPRTRRFRPLEDATSGVSISILNGDDVNNDMEKRNGDSMVDGDSKPGLARRVRIVVNQSIRFISSSIPVLKKRSVSSVAPIVSAEKEPVVVVVAQFEDEIDESAIIMEDRKSIVAANTTDLSGVWKPITNPAFLHQYDEYLKNCSQPMLFRRVVVNALGLTKDEIVQWDDGRSLTMISTNPAGKWNRTLTTTTPCAVVDPDKERVEVESYWYDGNRHCSVLKGKKKLQGGTFETIRYLDEANDQLICESYFHPNPKLLSKFQPGFVKWTFERIQSK